MTTATLFGRHDFRATGAIKMTWNVQARRILRRTSFHASRPSVWRISQKFDQVGAVVEFIFPKPEEQYGGARICGRCRR